MEKDILSLESRCYFLASNSILSSSSSKNRRREREERRATRVEGRTEPTKRGDRAGKLDEEEEEEEE